MLLASALLALAACAATAPQAPQASAPPDTTRNKPGAGAAPPAALPAEDVARYRPVFAAPKVAPVAAAPAPPCRPPAP